MAEKPRLTPRKKPRQERAKQTVRIILQAAAQVLADCGYESTTTDQIAERAGVSIGSLYQYFPNKEAVLVAVAKQHIDDGFARFHAALSDAGLAQRPPKQVLAEFVRAALDLEVHEPRLHQVLFEQGPLLATVLRYVRQRQQQIIDQLGGLLEHSPVSTCTDPRLSAYLVVHALEGLVHSFVADRAEGTEEDTFVDEVATMLLRYLTAPR